MRCRLHLSTGWNPSRNLSLAAQWRPLNKDHPLRPALVTAYAQQRRQSFLEMRTTGLDKGGAVRRRQR
jgi:hypothetical protein